MSKEIWKIVEDIPENTLFMMGFPMKSFFEDWPEKGLGKEFNKYITYYKGDFSNMIYIAKEFDKQAEFLSAKMFKDPAWALKILKEVEDVSTRFLKESKAIKKLALNKLNNGQIVKLLNKIYKHHQFSHGIGASLSWHADQGRELVTKGIIKIIEPKLKKSMIKKNISEVFPVLTSPHKKSFLEKEEESFLQIAKLINNKRKLKETFIHSDLDDLTDNIKNLDQVISKKIINHYHAYTSFTFQYRGPAYELVEYIGRWQAFFREGQSPTKLLNEIAKRRQQLISRQNKMLKELNFTQYEKDLIKMAQEMVFIKDYRKNALYNSMYYYEIVFKEVAKRMHLSLNQVWALKPWEITQALKTGRINQDELNKRQRFVADYWYRKNGKVYNKTYSGSAANEFYKKILIKKITNNTSELKGTCAYPGKVKGIVKIVNVPKDMDKMNKGDIMVAHNTNPNLVPAMKKAKALIGGAGGLTCHTAIVAREMQVPCVVGVADCDKVLKDGDTVEVNSTQGIIKKI